MCGKLSLLFCQRITYKWETECLPQFLPPQLQACGQQCFSFIGQLFWIPSPLSTGITEKYSQLLLSVMICGHTCACVQCLVMFLQLDSDTMTSDTRTQCTFGSKHKHGPLLGAGAILGALSFPECSVPLAEWHWPEATTSFYPKNFILAWDSRDNKEAEQASMLSQESRSSY